MYIWKKEQREKKKLAEQKYQNLKDLNYKKQQA